MTDFESLVWHGWRKENLDTQEIADKIGVTEAAVYNALGRARERQRWRRAGGMTTAPTFYVRAFERNCPGVRMTKDEREELRRLFVVMRSASKEEVYDERQKQSDQQ